MRLTLLCRRFTLNFKALIDKLDLEQSSSKADLRAAIKCIDQCHENVDKAFPHLLVIMYDAEVSQTYSNSVSSSGWYVQL